MCVYSYIRMYSYRIVYVKNFILGVMDEGIGIRGSIELEYIRR